MNIQDEQELEVTREKLRFMEARYNAIEAKPVANGYARDLTLRSLQKTINQLKEEIIRFESGAKKSRNYGDPEVTRRKLHLLEQEYEMACAKPTENGRPRELTLQSLRRFINQLKEDLVWAESRMRAGAREEPVCQ